MGERVLTKDFVRNVTETLGCAALKPAVAESLAQDVEFRLREIIGESLKFMRHCKRRTLRTSDIDSALRVRNIEPLFGFNSLIPLRFRPSMDATNNPDAMTIDDEVLDVEAMLNAPLPKVPLDLTFSAHWLAIEGVQPSIPQNPPPAPTLPLHRNNNNEDNFSNRQNVMGETVLPAIAGAAAAESRPTVKHVLSKEVQMYFEKITAALKSESHELRQIAWDGLREDAGLHQLLPYLVQFIQAEITRNLTEPVILNSMVSAIDSLLHNEYLFIEPYLHQLMPSLITCVVARTLSKNQYDRSHLQLRSRAAEMVAKLARDFGDLYPTLKPRVTRTFMRALLDLGKSLATHCGAIHALSLLGNEVRKIVLVPNAQMYMKYLQTREEGLKDDMDEDAVELAQFEIAECRRLYTNGVAQLFASLDGDLTTSESFAEMGAVFGEKELLSAIESIKAQE